MKLARLAPLAATAFAIAAIAARADVAGEAKAYQHGDVALEGYLAVDASVAGKRPGILVVPEWWGLNDYAKKRADMLAKLGYVAFAVDMYGKGKVTTDPKVAGGWAGAVKGDRKLMRARALAGLDVLKGHALVDPTRLAAIGYCFGGTTVLELARAGAPLAGVVSFHGGLDGPEPAAAKPIKAKVLALHGADDNFISREELLGFEKEMRESGADWQLVSYGGAVHAFSNPDADAFKIPGVAYNEPADRRSWQAMRTFFDEIFAKK